MIKGLIAQYFAVEQAPDSIPKLKVTDGTITNIFNVVLGLAGALAVAFIVYAGIQYILSQGDASKVKQAKDTILFSIVGLLVVIFAFAIINFVIGKF